MQSFKALYQILDPRLILIPVLLKAGYHRIRAVIIPDRLQL